VFTRFDDRATVRGELFRLTCELKRLGVTAIMTAEREREHGEISRFGIEEFVADNVILLRNSLEAEKRRRTVEILKFRGCPHQKGEWPFTIREQRGIVGVPLSSIRLDQRSSDTRITCGVPEMDELCGGGFFRDSITLCSGATGTGKTLLATHFVAGGIDNGQTERAMLFAFEESKDQLVRNARGWGMAFEQLERDDRLRVICEYPEVSSLEDHLIRMKNAMDEFQPNRVAIDSLSALQRISTTRTFREFIIGLSCHLKQREIAALFSAATPDLMGGASLTESHISTITDAIILLRYVEIYGEMRRGVTVLKMRGSFHDKDIREFTIDGQGMHIGKRFRNVSGILKGEPSQTSPDMIERVGTMFRADESDESAQDERASIPR
jgi:circadian clock protein KaiC